MTRKLLFVALFVLQATFFFGAGMWFEFDRRVNARERQIRREVRFGMDESEVVQKVGHADVVEPSPGGGKHLSYWLSNGNKQFLVVETRAGKVTRLFIQGS